MTFHFFFCCWC